jgi:hypothetical protein
LATPGVRGMHPSGYLQAGSGGGWPSQLATCRRIEATAHRWPVAGEERPGAGGVEALSRPPARSPP